MAEETANRPVTWVRWALLGLISFVSLILIAGGSILWGAAIGTWIRDGYIFHGWGMIDWIVGVIGAAGVAGGLFLTGIFLRVLRWGRAPLASLFLAIVSTAFLIATFAIYSQTGHDEQNIEVVILQVLCIAGVLVLALPPFLHWLRANPNAVSSSLPADKKGLVS